MFRPVKVRHYLSVMKSKGHAASAVLAGSGVTEEMLAQPDFLMDLNHSRVIVSNMITLTGEQGIGLEMGSRTDAVDLGLVGYLVMSSRTQREAIQHWIAYSDALVGIPTHLRLEEHAPDDWAFVLDESVPAGFVYNFCVEELLVMIYKLAGDLYGTKPIMKRLELAYPAPAHQGLYGRYFLGPIDFNSRHTRISFIAPRVDAPLRGNDPELNALCERQCDLLARQIGQRSPLVAEIRNILIRSRGNTPTIDNVARELSMSERTLRRHLKNEEMSFQQVVNEYRVDMAKQYLQSVSMAPKEIAYFLGFKDSNSFRRAFKLWTGKTVQQYRNDMNGAADAGPHD